MSIAQTKYIIGVTGGIGSGKTTVTNMFADKHIDIVDADVVAREVVEVKSDGLRAIVKAFGADILQENGELDRAKLRQIIFANEQDKLTLNAILHPLIRRNMLNQLQNTQSQYCMLSAPLLFENNLQALVDRSLLVDINEELQLQRTLGRDGGEQETIKNIMKSQMSRSEKLQRADDVIDNSKDLKSLKQQVDILHQKYLQLSEISK